MERTHIRSRDSLHDGVATWPMHIDTTLSIRTIILAVPRTTGPLNVIMRTSNSGSRELQDEPITQVGKISRMPASRLSSLSSRRFKVAWHENRLRCCCPLPHAASYKSSRRTGRRARGTTHLHLPPAVRTPDQSFASEHEERHLPPMVRGTTIHTAYQISQRLNACQLNAGQRS